jgi:hypothetical protein
LNKEEKISPLLRAISGVIGILGVASIAFNASQDGGIRLDFMLFASFFAGFVFLYASFFGKYPWDKSKADDTDESL